MARSLPQRLANRALVALIVTDRSEYPGGFPDRAARDRLDLAISVIQKLEFELHVAKSTAKRAARMWPEFATSAEVLCRIIDEAVHDADLLKMKKLAEERLARFEEEMGE